MQAIALENNGRLNGGSRPAPVAEHRLLGAHGGEVAREIVFWTDAGHVRSGGCGALRVRIKQLGKYSFLIKKKISIATQERSRKATLT